MEMFTARADNRVEERFEGNTDDHIEEWGLGKERKMEMRRKRKKRKERKSMNLRRNRMNLRRKKRKKRDRGPSIRVPCRSLISDSVLLPDEDRHSGDKHDAESHEHEGQLERW
jgi:hypothetical protein